MNFDETMDEFWKGYDRESPTYRKQAEANSEYQQAAREKNVTLCQEIAVRLIHGEAKTAKESKKFAPYY